MTVQGIITEVVTSPAGSTLETDLASGATVLFLDDVNEFNPAGGTAKIIDASAEAGTLVIEFAYTGLDFDEATLFVNPGQITTTVKAGADVLLTPEQTYTVAMLRTEESEEDLECVVPHAMLGYAALEDGQRSELTGELAVAHEVAGEWTLLDIVGRPAAITASTLVGSIPVDAQPEPVAPATSPPPEVWGVPGARPSIAAKIPGLENPTPVLYEFHISTSSATPPEPDGSTMYSTAGPDTGILMESLPSGTPLAYDTPEAPQVYYVAVWARSGDVYAAGPSPWVEVRISQVGAADIKTGSVTAGKLAAIITLSSLFRTAETGQRVEFDNGGIRIYDSAGATRINLTWEQATIDVDNAYIQRLRTGSGELGGVTLVPGGAEVAVKTSALEAPGLELQHEPVPVSRVTLAGDTTGPVFTDTTAAYWWRTGVSSSANQVAVSLERSTLNGSATTTLPATAITQSFSLGNNATAQGIWGAANGDVYVVDTLAAVVNRYNSTGVLQETITGLGSPFGITGDINGNIYVTDVTNSRVWKVTPAGVKTWFSTTGTPHDVTCVNDGSAIWVTDYQNNAVLRYTSSGTLSTGWSVPGTVRGIASSASAIFVTDIANDLLRIYSFTGTAQGTFAIPRAMRVAVDGESGHILVAAQKTVERYTVAGSLVASYPTPGNAASASLYALWADQNGNVMVTDTQSKTVRTIRMLGDWTVPTTVMSSALSDSLFIYLARNGTRDRISFVPRPTATTFDRPVSWALPNAPGTGGYAAGEPVIGTQRTTGDLLVAHRVQGAQTISGVSYANGQVMVRRWSVTFNTVLRQLILSLKQTIQVPLTTSTTLRAITMDSNNGAFDAATVSNQTAFALTLGAAGGGTGSVHNHIFYVATASTGNQVATALTGGLGQWKSGLASGVNQVGLEWTGTAFWGTEGDGRTIREYASSSDGSVNRWHAYTYYKTTPQETMLSPIIQSATLARHRSQWTIPKLPPGVTGVRLYTSGVSTSRATFQRVATSTGLPEGQPVVIRVNPIVPPGTITNPPPSASNYVTGVAGKITTAHADTAIYGDGQVTVRDPLLPTDAVNQRTLTSTATSIATTIATTMPPHVRRSATTTQVPTSSGSIVQFQTSDDAAVGITETSNSRFTIQTAGLYRVVGQATLSTNTTAVIFTLAVQRNGSSEAIARQMKPATSGTVSAYVGIDIRLNAGDYIEYLATANAGSNTLAGGGYTYMSIAKLTPVVS